MLLACPDRPGIVAAVTERLRQRGWNIVTLEQHVEGGDAFFMRVLAEAVGPDADRVRPELMELGNRFGGTVRLHDPQRRMRVGLLVTREPACAVDLLVRARLGQLPALIPVVVSNHRELGWLADMFEAGLIQDATIAASETQRRMLWRMREELSPAMRIEGQIVRNHVSYQGPVVVDARMKPWYPAELFCADETASLVSSRWSEYFPQGRVEMGDSERAHLD